MLKNHLKIAWRNLYAHPLFSVINILGLTIGLTITILLLMFIYHENSFDSGYVNKDQMYRVLVKTNENYDGRTYANAPAQISPSSIEAIPEVLNGVRFLKHGFGDAAYINTADDEFIEDFLFYADESLFEIFNIKLTAGNVESALANPETAIISNSTAHRYFGTFDVVGKTFKIDDRSEVKITGVYEDLPTNSTLDGNIYVSLKGSNFYKNPSWSNASLETYLLTQAGSNQQLIEKKLGEMLDKNVEKDNQWYSLELQPFNKVHLYSSQLQNGYSSRIGSINQVKSLSWLALLILVIACINYMNLTTARSQKRAREVGVSKTLGATVSNLVSRFYIETGLITFISIVLGIGLSLVALPYFNSIIGAQITASSLFSAEFWIFIVLIWFIATLVAGSYPALFLSNFSAKRILNRSATHSTGATAVRKGLVVMQFVASTVLIVGVFVIHDQMSFIRDQDLGFHKDQIIALSLNGINKQSDVDLLSQEISKMPQVIKAGAAQGYPGKSVSGRMIHNALVDDGGLPVQTNRADGSSLETLGLKFLAGKNLPEFKVEGDTLIDIVVNEKAIAYLNLTPEEAIGQKISMMPGDKSYIVGVVQDFNFESLHVPVGAYAFHNYDSENKEFLLVKMAATDVKSSISALENTFNSIVPNVAFDYTFLDKTIEKLYIKEEQTATIGVIFSGLAILVACLGLFGLAAFMAEQRDKEIGVRKVLGASILNITSLLSLDFIKLIIIALLIGFPISYWIMYNWLQEFAYRVEINYLPFLFTAITALIVALITIGFQSMKAALKNPISALRKE